MRKSDVVVVGAGIAGLTSAAILSKKGLSVTLIESHSQAGGCAGTFKRKNYIFDVGATQVAGLEKGGIHSRIFDFLDIPTPEATILDPACIVDLNDGGKPIPIWYEKSKWIAEQEMQFPGSQRFWKLCNLIHQSNWTFANNNPVLPISNFWDFSQLFKALVPSNLVTGFLLKSTIFDLLRICGLSKNERLIKFLNLQLKLYSQEDVFNTAALYGSTVLQMCQEPHGLWHLKKSMQSLSESLESSLIKTGVNLIFGQKVNSINFDEVKMCWKVSANSKKESFIGTIDQKKGWDDNWIDCFLNLRIIPQLLILQSKILEKETINKVLEKIKSELLNHKPINTLVHGDLWSGNAGTDKSGKGVIFDPASWWADNEVDIAMTKLFGGFSKEFYEEYHRIFPIKKGFEKRIIIYNFYHILNHANMFGGSYLKQVKDYVKAILNM